MARKYSFRWLSSELLTKSGLFEGFTAEWRTPLLGPASSHSQVKVELSKHEKVLMEAKDAFSNNSTETAWRLGGQKVSGLWDVPLRADTTLHRPPTQQLRRKGTWQLSGKILLALCFGGLLGGIVHNDWWSNARGWNARNFRLKGEARPSVRRKAFFFLVVLAF